MDVCYDYSTLPFTPGVSPPHRHFTSLSSGSIYKSQVRSSQVLQSRHTTVTLGILKGDGARVAIAPRLRWWRFFFIIELQRIYGNNWIGCITFRPAPVLHV